MAESDDRDLRERLQAADPARRPDAARPDWITELTEATMSQDPSTDPAPPPRRGRLAWLVAAAAVVIVAALGFAFIGGGDDPQQVAQQTDPTPSGEPTSPSEQPSEQPSDPPSGQTQEQQPSDQPSGSGGETLVVTVAETSARCIPPTPESTAKLATVAFEATVTKLAGKRATLEISQWYRTDPQARYGDTVVLRSSSGTLVNQVGGIAFEKGSSYLLAVNRNGQLVLCGHSGETDSALEGLYARAFAGD